MPFPIAGALGGLLLSRAGMAIAGGSGVASRFYKLPLVQGGQFGVGKVEYARSAKVPNKDILEPFIVRLPMGHIPTLRFVDYAKCRHIKK
jgi:hypothetical protein